MLLVTGALTLQFVLTKITPENCISHNDIIQQTFKSIDLSPYIFTLTYTPLLAFVIINRKKLDLIFIFVFCYGLLLYLRSITIYIIPLCEPDDAIRLNDPFLNTFFYPNGYSPYDLFFSGHVATVFIAFLLLKKKIKYLFLFNSIILGALVCIQKTHYTIDVLGAFPFAFICYKIGIRFLTYSKTKINL